MYRVRGCREMLQCPRLHEELPGTSLLPKGVILLGAEGDVRIRGSLLRGLGASSQLELTGWQAEKGLSVG